MRSIVRCNPGEGGAPRCRSEFAACPHPNPLPARAGRGGAARLAAYARVPLNGKLPIGPTPISPEMVSPETLPVNSSVSGIGLVIETFQATSSPLAVPSKISVELPSAPWVPVSAPPAFFRVSVALRSPIGVLMVMFQFPSTAIDVSSTLVRKTGMVLGSGWLGRRYSASRRLCPIVGRTRSGAGGANPVGDEDAKRDILHGKGCQFRSDQHYRNIQRPQLEVAGRC